MWCITTITTTPILQSMILYLSACLEIFDVPWRSNPSNESRWVALCTVHSTRQKTLKMRFWPLFDSCVTAKFPYICVWYRYMMKLIVHVKRCFLSDRLNTFVQYIIISHLLTQSDQILFFFKYFFVVKQHANLFDYAFLSSYIWRFWNIYVNALQLQD